MKIYSTSQLSNYFERTHTFTSKSNWFSLHSHLQFLLGVYRMAWSTGMFSKNGRQLEYEKYFISSKICPRIRNCSYY